jgi:hypothetical protein
MASISLYTASISQVGTNVPTATVGPGKLETSGSWSRIGTGSYKLTRGSGGFFSPISGSSISSSISGILNISINNSSTSSFNCYISGSDSSSIYLNTYLPNNTNTLVDNALSGSTNIINL